jgi:preprotein translocase subunit SecD
LVGQQLAFVLDVLVVLAPPVLAPITSGQGQLTGNPTEQRAKAIAAALQPG